MNCIIVWSTSNLSWSLHYYLCLFRTPHTASLSWLQILEAVTRKLWMKQCVWEFSGTCEACLVRLCVYSVKSFISGISAVGNMHTLLIHCTWCLLGLRWMYSRNGHYSYMHGAMTGLIASWLSHMVKSFRFPSPPSFPSSLPPATSPAEHTWAGKPHSQVHTHAHWKTINRPQFEYLIHNDNHRCPSTECMFKWRHT